MSEQELTAFIESEQERLEKNAKLTWYVGIGLVVFIGGYLTWISCFLRNELLNPDQLAKVIAGNIRADIPGYIQNTEQELIARAPELADGVSEEIQASIPRVRGEIQRKIDDVYTTIPALEWEISETIKVYVAEHSDEIKAVAAAHSEEEFAEHFTNDLVKEVLTKFDDRLRVRTGGDGLQEFRIDSLNSLQELDKELGALLAQNRHRMSRSDLLKRRLVVSLYHLFTQAVAGAA